jgi:cytoskeletal protein CcmA (bactofilin family)
MIWKRDEAAEGGQPEGGKRMAEQSGGEVTIVGQGAKLEGKIVSAGSLRIDGQIKGTIDADGDVMMSPQSAVEADVNAANVSVAGRFKGDIIVKGKAEIARGGRVDGNITAKSLVIQEGATFNGQSKMDGAAVAPAPQASAPAKGEGDK